MSGFNLNAARDVLNREAGPLPTLLALMAFAGMIAVLCLACRS